MKIYIVIKYDFGWKETYMLGAFSSQQSAINVVEKEISKGGEWVKVGHWIKNEEYKEQEWINVKGPNSGNLTIYEEELQD